MVCFSNSLKFGPFRFEQRLKPRPAPAGVARRQPCERRVGMIGERRHPCSKKVVFNHRFGGPNVGGHAFTGRRQPLKSAALQADMTPDRKVSGRGLKIFDGTRQHRTSLVPVLFYEPCKRRGQEFWKHLKALRCTIPVGWNVRDKGGPWALGLRQSRRSGHASVEGVEHRVLLWYTPFGQGLVC